MDKQTQSQARSDTGGTLQRLVLGSLYLSLLAVLLSASFFAPPVGEIVRNDEFLPAVIVPAEQLVSPAERGPMES